MTTVWTIKQNTGYQTRHNLFSQSNVQYALNSSLQYPPAISISAAGYANMGDRFCSSTSSQPVESLAACPASPAPQVLDQPSIQQVPCGGFQTTERTKFHQVILHSARAWLGTCGWGCVLQMSTPTLSQTPLPGSGPSLSTQLCDPDIFSSDRRQLSIKGAALSLTRPNPKWG